MAEAQKLEIVCMALKTVKALRCSVGYVLETLAGGLQTSSQQQDDQESTHKAFLHKLQLALLNVNNKFRELDTLVSTLGAPTGPVNLENSGNLSQDPTSEGVALYQEMMHAYKWFDKAHDVASHAAVILTQNSLKRSNINPGLSVKRTRKMPQTSHNVPTHVVDSVVTTVDRLFPDMSVSISRPMGTSAILQITLAKTLKAVLVLRSLIIEWVSVKAYHEDLHTEDGKLDVWSGSRYKVFQQVTEHANAAALHFYSPLIPELAIKSFMTWLHSFSSLFDAPCHRCGNHLHDSMIPTWRDFRTLDAFHESCRP